MAEDSTHQHTITLDTAILAYSTGGIQQLALACGPRWPRQRISTPLPAIRAYETGGIHQQRHGSWDEASPSDSNALPSLTVPTSHGLHTTSKAAAPRPPEGLERHGVTGGRGFGVGFASDAAAPLDPRRRYMEPRRRTGAIENTGAISPVASRQGFPTARPTWTQLQLLHTSLWDSCVTARAWAPVHRNWAHNRSHHHWRDGRSLQLPPSQRHRRCRLPLATYRSWTLLAWRQLALRWLDGKEA